MRFDDFIGHERPIRLLKAMLAAGRLPHALLITGPTGVGKRSLARVAAQAANCLVEDPAERPCGRCRACDKISRGGHPDVVELELEGKKQIIKIEAVRDLRTRIAFKPYEGRTKVFLAPRADRMNEEAANALLKTLEEPPPDSLLILTAPNESDLMPTILSRCVRLSLAPLPLAEIENWLSRVRGLDGPRARLTASLSEGSLGWAKEVDPDELWEIRRGLLEKLTGLDPADPIPALEWAGELAGMTESRPLVFSLMRFWYRDLMISAGGAGAARLVNLDLVDEIKAAAAGRPVDAFISALAEIDRAEDAIDRFIRPELVMENMVLALADLEKV